jgi:hypothetical protein
LHVTLGTGKQAPTAEHPSDSGKPQRLPAPHCTSAEQVPASPAPELLLDPELPDPEPLPDPEDPELVLDPELPPEVPLDESAKPPLDPELVPELLPAAASLELEAFPPLPQPAANATSSPRARLPCFITLRGWPSLG